MKTKLMYVVMAAMLLGSGLNLSAQDNKKDNKASRPRFTPEQMMKMQAGQMAKVLMLDDATTAKFTTVYEKYLQELRECRQANRTPRGTANMTDEDIAKTLKGQFEQSRKTLDIREKYYEEFSKVLTQKQIMKIYQQEKNNTNKFRNEFNRRQGSKFGQGNQPRFNRQSRAPKSAANNNK